MDSTMKKEQVIICRRTSEGQAHVPSVKDTCSECGEEIWIAHSSPQARKICTVCAVKLLPEEIQVMPPTLAQQEELAAYYRAHPEERDGAIEAFQSVTPGDLNEVEGLTPVIERLCSSLRELRREHPKQFFGRPVERLYDSLDAALGSFYRSQVESTSPGVPNDPGANEAL